LHRRLRRPAAALGAALLIPALVACGGGSDDSDSSSSASESSSAGSGEAAPTGELDGVSFTGDVGDDLTAKWTAAIDAPSETEVTTLVKGDGDPVADGDTVSTYLWLGNGTTQKEAFSDYSNGAAEALPIDQILAGATYGSRVAAVLPASDIFGSQGNEQLGIGADDTLVVVADLVEKAEESPTPSSDSAEDAEPDTQPSVIEKDGKPTGLDFSGIEEPALDTPVQRVVLEEGDGAAVKASDTVEVDYLGSTYQADAPFDESYSGGQPLTSPLSGLIKGWSIGLTGVKVGSRVLLQIPPAYGYGAQGSGESIPANATLWFVIDVRGVQ
jgi:peptidylprolyl isomerase